MQTTTFTYVPKPDSEGEILTRSMDILGTLPKTYVIAEKVAGQFKYQHKITLLNGGNVLQILTKEPGTSGKFTEALPENAYSIENQFIRLSLLDSLGDGSKYEIHLSNDPGRPSTSNAVLSATKSPQVNFVEVLYKDGTDARAELNFIGTTDIRPALQGRVIVAPGESVQIKCDSGNIVFQY
jgi:hypothetical protein